MCFTQPKTFKDINIFCMFLFCFLCACVWSVAVSVVVCARVCVCA